MCCETRRALRLRRPHGEADRSVVMRSPCAGAALDPPLWIVPNKALSQTLSLRLSGSLAGCHGAAGHSVNCDTGMTHTNKSGPHTQAESRRPGCVSRCVLSPGGQGVTVCHSPGGLGLA
jgi:hypothetical protein